MESWVAEYSVSQDCFHIVELRETIVHNRDSMLENIGNDYRIIAICADRDEALYVTQKYRELIGVRGSGK